jgi:ATP phosphoribosyltransferase regulatory subunit HisZ
MNNNSNEPNNGLNKNLVDLLSNIDKSKIDTLSKMVQNMSTDDLSNLVRMIGKNTNKDKK